ncbi:hypothetical protein [Maribacter ulvicola]|uniref:Uncharacterized protein n=1 Tax=Maribacter ulvicola TaxID=228959 RepID=A0A1N6Y5L8_9FLAO|nr:hypothetical protein [Maribacter ulvicola]SIR09816.1 hypothetical protein SAMN05421797_10687 [Maribacter ulvicola]
MSIPQRIILAILACVAMQSCSKDTDIISEFVVLDAAKTEYRSVKVSSDFEIEKSEKTVALIPFSD